MALIEPKTIRESAKWLDNYGYNCDSSVGKDGAKVMLWTSTQGTFGPVKERRDGFPMTKTIEGKNEAEVVAAMNAFYKEIFQQHKSADQAREQARRDKFEQSLKDQK
jgi:hypothetical protein